MSNALAEREHVIGVFMDLSKAFDTLDHAILIRKLEYYGLRGVTIQWFKNYLTNRKQYVYYDSIESELLPIECGVPQGSILGPLLFFIYVNDISYSSNALQYILFADDANVFCSNSDLNTLLRTINTELPKLSKWFKSNKLSLNLKKIFFIYFQNRKTNNDIPPLEIILDGRPLDKQENAKFLRVLNENLRWNIHVQNISKII